MKYLSLIVLFILSCSNSTESKKKYIQSSNSESYFPMSVGNKWDYMNENNEIAFSTEITATKEIDNKLYYEFTRTFSYPDNNVDKEYYREENNIIYKRFWLGNNIYSGEFIFFNLKSYAYPIYIGDYYRYAVSVDRGENFLTYKIHNASDLERKDIIKLVKGIGITLNHKFNTYGSTVGNYSVK